MRLCIYCREQFDETAGKGDHFPPAAFGEFADLRRFRGACPKCNNQFGTSDAQLRCGPFGHLAGISQPHARRRGAGNAVKGAAGAPPPHTWVIRDGIRMESVQHGSNPQHRSVPDHLEVVADGIAHTIRIFPGQEARHVEERIAALELQHWTKTRVKAQGDRLLWLKDLLLSLFPNAVWEDRETTPPGQHLREGTTHFAVTDHYFRALARIAFHYFLCYNPWGLQGDEKEFSSIRRFIQRGGDCRPFFTRTIDDLVGFGIPFRETIPDYNHRTGTWHHHLMAYPVSGCWVVVANFFRLEGDALRPDYVNLGPVADCRSPDCTFGHLLSWEAASGKKGWVTPFTPILESG